jgi:hypothetical protein
MALGGALILFWAGTMFTHGSTERAMIATALMLLGVMLFSINAAALGEDLFGGDEGH